MPGEVLYEGPSMFGGAEIGVIFTHPPSDNEKLGVEFGQAWILVRKANPVRAQLLGLDRQICGDCRLRPHVRKRAKRDGDVVLPQGCYVTTWRAPRVVWATWRRGRYMTKQDWVAPSWWRARLGAYGDPAAVPIGVWHELSARFPRTSGKPRILGYTQRWRDCDQGLREFCMASCSSAEEALDAWRSGWRPYRARRKDESLIEKLEFQCPASAEEGKRLTCSKCMACYGAMPGRPVQPAWPTIFFH